MPIGLRSFCTYYLSPGICGFSLRNQWPTSIQFLIGGLFLLNASRYKKTLGPTKVEKVRPSVTKLTFLIHVRKRVRSVKNIMLDLRPDLFTKNIFISTTNRFSLFGPCCRSAKITEASVYWMMKKFIIISVVILSQ